MIPKIAEPAISSPMVVPTVPRKSQTAIGKMCRWSASANLASRPDPTRRQSPPIPAWQSVACRARGRAAHVRREQPRLPCAAAPSEAAAQAHPLHVCSQSGCPLSERGSGRSKIGWGCVRGKKGWKKIRGGIEDEM
eukprot:scaffold59371_cov36-Tisochrysis_lutea.AAC.1